MTLASKSTLRTGPAPRQAVGCYLTLVMDVLDVYREEIANSPEARHHIEKAFQVLSLDKVFDPRGFYEAKEGA